MYWTRALVYVKRKRIVLAERGYRYHAGRARGASVVFGFVGGKGTHSAAPDGSSRVGCSAFGFHLLSGM